MAHETGQQRYRRLKRDPLRRQVPATSWTIPPVRCECGHAGLMHQHGHSAIGEKCANEGRCLSYGCDCERWNEEVPD